MSKSSKSKNTIYDLVLQTRGESSHNEEQIEARIKALVEQMARLAAQEDFKMYQDALRSQDRKLEDT